MFDQRVVGEFEMNSEDHPSKAKDDLTTQAEVEDALIAELYL